MEEIEAAVGEGNAIACPAPIRHALPKFIARNNLPMECCAQMISI
jgi:hypothetical protein